MEHRPETFKYFTYRQMKTFSAITFMLLLFCHFANADFDTEYSDVGPEYESTPSILTLKLSVMSALLETAKAAISITALKPAEFNFGVFSSSKEEGTFMSAGVSIPWRDINHTREGMVREIFITGGFKYSKPGPEFNKGTLSNAIADPPDHLKSILVTIGLEAVEWLMPIFGLSWQMSLSMDYLLTEYENAPRISPIVDVTVGVAF